MHVYKCTCTLSSNLSHMYFVSRAHVYMYVDVLTSFMTFFAHLEHRWFIESVVDQAVSQHPDIFTKGLYGVS